MSIPGSPHPSPSQGRTPFSVTLKLVDPKDKHQLLELHYDLLNILEFNNDRKRMSVSQMATQGYNYIVIA